MMKRTAAFIEVKAEVRFWEDARVDVAFNEQALTAFCHPAHLHTYDPEKQIVVSRDDLAALLDYWFGNCPNDKFAQACEAAAELHAALEVKP